MENPLHDGEFELIVDLFATLREELGEEAEIVATLYGVREEEDLDDVKEFLEYVDYV